MKISFAATSVKPACRSIPSTSRPTPSVSLTEAACMRVNTSGMRFRPMAPIR